MAMCSVPFASRRAFKVPFAARRWMVARETPSWVAAAATDISPSGNGSSRWMASVSYTHLTLPTSDLV